MIHRFLQSRAGLWLRNKIEFKIKKLENIHKGESCYIFGDGHTIKYYNISNFSDKIGIACNHFPFHSDFLKANIKYCVLSEPYYFYPFFDYFVKNRKVETKYFLNPISYKYRSLIRKNPNISFFVNLSNYFVTFYKNIFYLYKNIPQNNSDFNKRLCEKFDCDKGVLRRTISLAVHMGFEEIILVGCDYLFYPRLYGHWYEFGEPREHFIKDKNYIDEFISYIKEIKNINIKIITPFELKSSLETIEYYSVFKEKVSYKENFQILGKKNLEIFLKQRTMNLFKK